MGVGCFMPYKHLGLFSQRRQVWTYSVLGDRIYEMKKVKMAGDRNRRSFLLYNIWSVSLICLVGRLILLICTLYCAHRPVTERLVEINILGQSEPLMHLGITCKKGEGGLTSMYIYCRLLQSGWSTESLFFQSLEDM